MSPLTLSLLSAALSFGGEAPAPGLTHEEIQARIAIEIELAKLTTQPEPKSLSGFIKIPPVPQKQSVPKQMPVATVKVKVETAPLRGPGWHRHQCPDCKTVWSHGPPNNNRPGAHNCPNCGSYQNVHYEGPAPYRWEVRQVQAPPPPAPVIRAAPQPTALISLPQADANCVD